MTDYTEYIPKLVKFGYNEMENICDFWFLNKTKIAPKLFGSTGNEDQFSLLVRWESEIGRECSKAVRQFIRDKEPELLLLRQCKLTPDERRYTDQCRR